MSPHHEGHEKIKSISDRLLVSRVEHCGVGSGMWDVDPSILIVVVGPILSLNRAVRHLYASTTIAQSNIPNVADQQ